VRVPVWYYVVYRTKVRFVPCKAIRHRVGERYATHTRTGTIATIEEQRSL